MISGLPGASEGEDLVRRDLRRAAAEVAQLGLQGELSGEGSQGGEGV